MHKFSLTNHLKAEWRLVSQISKAGAKGGIERE